MTTTVMAPSLPGRMRQSDVDFDIARADMMTPFSLSLAAEKAIESAKRQLDAMDERLMRARMSMADVRRKAGDRRVSESEVDESRRGWTEPVVSEERRSISDSYRIAQPLEAEVSGENEVERKTIEMKRLRDDLRDLRSRMSQSRSVGDTMRLTPPRPRRPSAAEIPDLKALAKSLEGHHFDLSAFPSPPSMPAVDAAFRPSSTASELDSPVIVPSQENPFSPRPYSSLSILEPLQVKPYPESQLKPFPKTMIPFREFPARRQESIKQSVPSSREPFADLPRRPRPQSHRRSSGSDTAEYSDPDTSIGTRTPSAQSPSRSANIVSPGTSNIPRYKRSSSDFSKDQRKSADSLLSDSEHQDLLVRVENLLHRISLLDPGTEEERRRRRKLQAAIAILEDSEEE